MAEPISQSKKPEKAINMVNGVLFTIAVILFVAFIEAITSKHHHQEEGK